MIKTVVFDIGKVLCEFDWENYIDALPLTTKEKERVKHATVLHPIWLEHDRGILSDEEITIAMCNLDPELSFYIRQFNENMSALVYEYEYAVELVKGMKEQGLQVLLLSNYGETSFLEGKERFQFMNYVDGGVISYEYKVVKPEKEIYQILIDKYKLEGKETVFLDDKEENVLTAKELGMNGIVFHTIEQAKKELEELGIVYDGLESSTK